jgi:hypothetical protein
MTGSPEPAIHTVKPDLGRKLNGNYQDEMGNRFNTRIESSRADAIPSLLPKVFGLSPQSFLEAHSYDLLV